ncbi:MAG: aldo/keto reductase [Rhodothermales bacterium]
MEYRYLGDTGVQISELAFGTMSFGGDADEHTSARMFHRCRDAGINLFDCANVYQDGRAEEILGRLIADCRDDVIVTSKCYFPIGDDVNARGASRRHIHQAVEDSLRRLGTDRIDVYFIHRFDGRTPMEETLRALDDLVRAGKVVYLGASNFAAWQVAKALGLSALHGLDAFKVIQPMYNLVKRQAEVEILPMALSEQLGVLVYSPLGGGLLTGKYAPDRRPDQGRIVEWEMYAERYREERVFEAANRFTTFARERDYDPVALAVAWAGSHPAVTAPLIGARNVNQLEGSLAAAEIDVTDELRREISALSEVPPPATDRSEEGTEAGTWIR